MIKPSEKRAYEKATKNSSRKSYLILLIAFVTYLLSLISLLAFIQAKIPTIVYTGDLYVPGYVQRNPTLCPALGAKMRIIIMVASATSNVKARNAIRRTWGSYRNRSDVAIAFVLGAPPPALKKAIAKEHAKHRDLIIGHFLDTYSNLTLKTLLMLEWVNKYCPDAQFFLKTDDDVYLNVPEWVSFASSPKRRKASLTIWGEAMRQTMPRRCSKVSKLKMCVPPQQFPGLMYPDYVNGPAYLMSMDCVRPLLHAAPSEPYLGLEDVFVTGVMAARLGISRRQVPFTFIKAKTARTLKYPCVIQRQLVVYEIKDLKHFDFWHQQHKLCSRQTPVKRSRV